MRLLHRIRGRLRVLFPGRAKDRPTDPYFAALSVARRRRQAIARALARDPHGGFTLVPLDREPRGGFRLVALDREPRDGFTLVPLDRDGHR